MKYFIILFFISVSYFRSNAENNLEAISYNQTIMLEQDRVGYRLSEFIQHVSGKNLVLLQMQILNSTESLNALQPYKDDSGLLIAARQLFNCYKEVSKFQYPKLLALVENPDVGDEDFDKELLAIKKEISDIENPFDKKFSEEQEKFAVKYGFQFKQ